MSYYKEDLNLTNKNSLSQQKSTFKAWIFGRDREERSQVINALKQEQWPLVTIQSLDYFESLASQLSPDILILCSDTMSTFGNQLIRELRKKGTTFPILCIGKILQAENCIIALEEGADDYLHSPLNKREFVSRARRAARAISPQRAIEPRSAPQSHGALEPQSQSPGELTCQQNNEQTDRGGHQQPAFI